jgi:rhodanese-related sulfurtransferase
MYGTVTFIIVAVIAVATGLLIKRARDQRRLEAHTITAEGLHALVEAQAKPMIFDVRVPLDLLADSEIIPGAKRIPPKEVLSNPDLIPREADAVVYCTCPSDETARAILRLALDLRFTRVKLLRGGLAAWKAAGYPVEPYEASFRLDSA